MGLVATLRTWGATAAEVARPVLGDELVAQPMFSATRAITIAAPATAVFPWLLQMGYGRAGWYSYDWIDNLGRPSARQIQPEWQSVQAGDSVPAGPVAFTAALVEPDRAFGLLLDRPRVRFSLCFELDERSGETRLVSRARSRLAVPGGRWLAKGLLEPGDGIMVRKQLLGIKERAESVAG